MTHISLLPFQNKAQSPTCGLALLASLYPLLSQEVQGCLVFVPLAFAQDTASSGSTQCHLLEAFHSQTAHSQAALGSQLGEGGQGSPVGSLASRPSISYSKTECYEGRDTSPHTPALFTWLSQFSPARGPTLTGPRTHPHLAPSALPPSWSRRCQGPHRSRWNLEWAQARKGVSWAFPEAVPWALSG